MADKIITAIDEMGGWVIKEVPNLFGKIPVVYADVFQPEWDEVAFLMDAREMRISRMVDTNDYYGDPMLKTFDVADLPTKDTVGKRIVFTSKSTSGNATIVSWRCGIPYLERLSTICG